MNQRLALVAILVRDYDEAIAWYTGVLGFGLVEDTSMGNGKRWVVVGPEAGGTAGSDDSTVGPAPTAGPAASDGSTTMAKPETAVGPGTAPATGLLLARAASPRQAERVGDQTGGRVFLFLDTDDFRRDYERLQSRGVRFVENPREESYGTVVVFEDLYGNRWDLVQRRRAVR